MLRYPFEDNFPAVRGVESHEHISKQNNDKSLGTITETIDYIIHKRFQNYNISLAVEDNQAKGCQREEICKDIFNGIGTFATIFLGYFNSFLLNLFFYLLRSELDRKSV